MATERITVVDNTQPITLNDGNDEYVFTVSCDEYIFTISDTELYRPAYKFNNRRNSMYIEVLPIF